MGERVTLRTVDGNHVEASNGRQQFVLDLPKEDGGEGNGFGPHETLLAALGACTAMTLAIYSKRKGIPLEGVDLVIERQPAPVGAGETPQKIVVDLRLRGPLDDAQRQRLLEIARKCPVYKTLTNDLDVVERLAS